MEVKETEPSYESDTDVDWSSFIAEDEVEEVEEEPPVQNVHVQEPLTTYVCNTSGCAFKTGSKSSCR